jgi:hypothetical protein
MAAQDGPRYPRTTRLEQRQSACSCRQEETPDESPRNSVTSLAQANKLVDAYEAISNNPVWTA